MKAATTNIYENNNNGKLKQILKFGVYNIILPHFLYYCVQHIIENYTTYGIVKGPVELTTDFFQFLQTNFWIFTILFLGTVIQIIAVFVTEKLLASNYMSETSGLALQGCNVSAMIVTSIVLFQISEISPVGGHLCTGYTSIPFFKLFTYVCENKRRRDEYRKKQLDRNYDKRLNNQNANVVPYPKNVQLKSLFIFMTCTGNLLYNPNGLIKTERKLKKAFRAILFGIIIHYVCAFITYQYVLPEVNLVKIHLNNEQYLKLVACFCKVIVPLNIVWLLHYNYWILTYLLPLNGWIWGYENATYNLDWWNATNFTEYWCKWNFQVHSILKTYFFIPLIKRGYSKQSASIFVGLVTGIVHEYFVTAPLRSSYGLAILAMNFQILLSIFTKFLAKKFGAQIGNMFVIGTLTFNFTFAFCLLYCNL